MATVYSVNCCWIVLEGQAVGAAESSSCGWVGKPKAIGGLRLIQEKAALWADGF